MKSNHTHTAKCLRCGRTRHFRSAEAVAKASPYGRTCRALIRAAAIAKVVRDFTAAQVEKARELLTDGGLVPVRPGIWQAISSDGVTRYLVSGETDNCPSGIHGRLCYHVCAARIVTAGKVA